MIIPIIAGSKIAHLDFKKLPKYFQNDYNILHSHQQYMSNPIFPYPHPHLVMLLLLILIILLDVWCYLIG